MYMDTFDHVYGFGEIVGDKPRYLYYGKRIGLHKVSKPAIIHPMKQLLNTLLRIPLNCFLTGHKYIDYGSLTLIYTKCGNQIII